jgi:hypothetical protein
MKMESLLKYGFTLPTAEYNGGVLAGLGLGVLATTIVLSPEHRITVPWVWFVVIGCIVAGSLLARGAQRKRFQSEGANEKHDA